jgi:DMSO/TMAO reductase YedYZ molybdopterin-dependent catalytic subunit
VGASVETSPDRRGFLVRLGLASAAVTVTGTAVAAVLARRVDSAPPEDATVPPPGPDHPPTRPGAITPAPGTRPEYTPVADHYRIDIDLRVPALDGRAWRLKVDGLVARPAELSLQDFVGERWGAPLQQVITLSCISNPIAGELIGTTRWTGVSLGRVLAGLGVKPEARFVSITSADGFHECLPLALARDDPRVMLAYAWDGAPLPQEHGFPLRIYIPDRYGMKQPKWITRLELTADERTGYWVERGWDETARMKATSVIDTVAVDSRYRWRDRTLVPIGGIAHAGDRGISRVEVRIDDGPWTAAALRTPLSPLTWVIWRNDWPFAPGRHTFAVRCFDGAGRAQISEEHPPYPSGATGIHSVERDLPRS